MMKNRFFKILTVITAVLGFIAGIYNQEVSTFFLNRDALIGLLLATLILYCFYTSHLQKNIRRHASHINDMSSELEALKEYKYSRKNFKQKLDSLETKMDQRFTNIERILKIRKK